MTSQLDPVASGHCSRHCDDQKCCLYHCRIHYMSLSKEQQKVIKEKKQARKEERRRNKEKKHAQNFEATHSTPISENNVQTVAQIDPSLGDPFSLNVDPKKFDGSSSGMLKSNREEGRSLISQRYLESVWRKQEEEYKNNLLKKDEMRKRTNRAGSGFYSHQSFDVPTLRRSHTDQKTDRERAMPRARRPDESFSNYLMAVSMEKQVENTAVVTPNIPELSNAPVARPLVPLPPSTKPVQQRSTEWNWRKARAFLTNHLLSADGYRVSDASKFELDGIPIGGWEFEGLKTLGAGNSSGRNHRLFKAKVTRNRRVFLKVIPYEKWKDQFDLMDEFMGEWVTDGENFIMEAAILATLTKKKSEIVPELFCLAEVFARDPKNIQSSDLSRSRSSYQHHPSHIAIISELFGQDLHSKLVKYRHKYIEKLDSGEKAPKIIARQRELIAQCGNLMQRYHDEGFCHLDFTAENILLGTDPNDPNSTKWKLCDFGKSTLRRTKYLRHVPNSVSKQDEIHLFESCEPTIGKSFFIPPECTKILTRLDKEGIYVPCTTYAHNMFPIEKYDGNYESNRTHRQPLYFRADLADIYQLAVLSLVICTFGQASSKKIFPQPKSMQPIFDDGILKKLKRLVPDNTIWTPEFIQLMKKNTAQNPVTRDTLNEMVQKMLEIFKAIRVKEKKSRTDLC
eukprot:GHVH01006224.1.p1 GENE.GHVH01006224.1~~GHVH01006224.1.p1  ORF type:complete len:680 (+),score=84.77 GHVH01006224.1:233-2272(+)